MAGKQGSVGSALPLLPLEKDRRNLYSTSIRGPYFALGTREHGKSTKIIHLSPKTSFSTKVAQLKDAMKEKLGVYTGRRAEIRRL